MASSKDEAVQRLKEILQKDREAVKHAAAPSKTDKAS
ncbi:MAG: hypothetical protein JWM80_254 [Cyanobacteria bacterium RYN_339]|nr:hypothetical protein [Cyanobacteria bacterium RYN_339]